MAKMLLREISPVDAAYLSNICQHPGFEIIKRMMDEACDFATQEVIKLDPMIEGYEKKLANLQLTARAINDFCSSFKRSIEAHHNRAFEPDETKEIEAAMLSKLKALQQS